MKVILRFIDISKRSFRNNWAVDVSNVSRFAGLSHLIASEASSCKALITTPDSLGKDFKKQ